MAISDIKVKAVISLINVIKNLYKNSFPEDNGILNEIKRVSILLENIPSLSGKFVESSHPIVQNIAAVLAAGKSSQPELINAIRDVIYYLPWKYNYSDRSDAPDLGRNIAFAEIIGPEAPFVSKSVCLGLTLIAPNTLYPMHKHPAIELYYTVAGSAVWSAGVTSRRNFPGKYILHPSNIIHSMQTADGPMLAIYSWTGDDVETISVYTDKD